MARCASARTSNPKPNPNPNPNPNPYPHLNPNPNPNPSQVRLSTHVERINVDESGRAVGVTLRGGEVLPAS